MQLRESFSVGSLTPISVAGRSGGASPPSSVKTWLAVRHSRSCLEDPGQVAGFLSLRGEEDLRPPDFSKMAVVAENILVAAQDGARDDRIIGVADFRRTESWMMSASLAI